MWEIVIPYWTRVKVTNISDELLTAKDISQLYKGRWEIELVFKELKSKLTIGTISLTHKSQMANEFLGEEMHNDTIEK